jgi:hypothetical protein
MIQGLAWPWYHPMPDLRAGHTHESFISKKKPHESWRSNLLVQSLIGWSTYDEDEHHEKPFNYDFRKNPFAPHECRASTISEFQ